MHTRVIAFSMLALVADCGPAGDAHPPTRIVSGRLELPPGSPIAYGALSVASTFDTEPVGPDGSFSLEVAGVQGHLMLAVAPDPAGNPRPLLFRVLRPGSDASVSTRSTAVALLLLAPFIASADPELLAEIEPLLERTPGLADLEDRISSAVASGKFLDELAEDLDFQQTYMTVVSAALDALAVPAPEGLVRGAATSALTVTPPDERSGIQVVPDTGTYVTLRNRGRRWVSAYVGPPGQDKLVGFVESAPPILSSATILQFSLAAASEQTLDIDVPLPTDLRVYGPGLAAPLADCPRPGYSDVRLLVPTVATAIDDFVSPTLDLVLGLNVRSLSVYQDFLIDLSIQVLSDATCLQAFADARWGGIAKCVLSSAASALVNTAISVSLNATDQWLGFHKKGPKFKKFSNAMAKVLGEGGDTRRIQFVSLDGKWILKILSSAGFGALQIVAQWTIAPLKFAKMACSALDLGKAIGTTLSARPAECFAVGASCNASCAGRNCGSDGCGGSCGTCQGGFRCEGGTCKPGASACTWHATRKCINMDLWWVDGCGNKETVAEDCVRDCNGGACCVPHAGTTCIGSSVFYVDSCGIPEGSPKESCALPKKCISGQCASQCSDTCPSAGKRECVDGVRYRTCDYFGSGCLKWGEPLPCSSGMHCAAGQCVSCQPDCAGKECGGDGCGGTCGTCPTGRECSFNTCAKAGNPTFGLVWYSPEDLDLHVRAPDGCEIYFSNPTCGSGALDLDDLAGCQDKAAPGGGPEHVFYTPGTAPAGTYDVWVVFFGGCTPGVQSVSFSLQATIDGTTVLDTEASIQAIAGKESQHWTVTVQ